MNNERVAKELLKLAKTITSGCEKLPEGGMRDNCEKKKEEGKKNKDKKAVVAKQLLKLARELTAGSSGADWKKVTSGFENEAIRFSKELNEFWKYLEATKKSMTAYVNQSNSGDVKADYENVYRRTKERRDTMAELVVLLGKAKNLK